MQHTKIHTKTQSRFGVNGARFELRTHPPLRRNKRAHRWSGDRMTTLTLRNSRASAPSHTDFTSQPIYADLATVLTILLRSQRTDTATRRGENRAEQGVRNTGTSTGASTVYRCPSPVLIPIGTQKPYRPERTTGCRCQFTITHYPPPYFRRRDRRRVPTEFRPPQSQQRQSGKPSTSKTRNCTSQGTREAAARPRCLHHVGPLRGEMHVLRT